MQPGIYMKSDPTGDIKYLQVKDINPENKLDYSQITMVKDRGIGVQYWLRKNDLLFAAKGASNYCFLYNGLDENIIASPSFIIIRIISKDILPEFLCCFLNTPSILNKLKNSSVGTGIQVIPQTVLSALQLDIPSMQIQQLIVQMDLLRRESESIYSEINELKQSLQDQLLMDSLEQDIL